MMNGIGRLADVVRIRSPGNGRRAWNAGGRLAEEALLRHQATEVLRNAGAALASGRPEEKRAVVQAIAELLQGSGNREALSRMGYAPSWRLMDMGDMETPMGERTVLEELLVVRGRLEGRSTSLQAAE